jgi:hypothetical protein
MNFCSFTGGVAFVASRVSARRPSSFLLGRQKKRTKEKATLVFASPALGAGATCAARKARASRKLALRAQTCVPLIPRFAALLGANTREEEKAPPQMSGSVAPQLLCRRAEERRGGRMKQDACLSVASLQPARPTRAPQVARSAAKGHAYQGRLFLGYFILAKQKKVDRPPGRDPASPARNILLQSQPNA